MKIDRVKVKNFKSLKELDITLSNLTLVTGVNSTGKSSFIQSLLLLRQNKEIINTFSMYSMMLKTPDKNKEFLEYVQSKLYNLSFIIQDKYVSLGDKNRIFFENTFDENITIDITVEDNNLSIAFDKDLKTKVTSNKNINFHNINLFKKSFQYIQTDRVSPAITYKLSETDIQNNSIGLQGEFTAHYLAEKKDQDLFLEKLKHEDSVSNQLLENVSLWLNEISQGIDISATVNPSQDNVTLSYSYKYNDGRTNEYNPLNVGFGITYVLPIIVSILKAKKGDLLIIENPESHLHPAGQSKIAELCAIASANGVQIIVETHSDHFLNGVRVATKKGLLKPSDSQIYYFSKEFGELETKIDKINIDENGKIDNWVKGFFDEYSNQLDNLLW
jgi:predicted ATPase